METNTNLLNTVNRNCIICNSTEYNSIFTLSDDYNNFFDNSNKDSVKLNSKLGSGNVLNTNNCEISICSTRFKDKIIILSAIDNLIKGASGQAIQNMNLLFNFPEQLALK